jgi:hypothetical protein
LPRGRFAALVGSGSISVDIQRFTIHDSRLAALTGRRGFGLALATGAAFFVLAVDADLILSNSDSAFTSFFFVFANLAFNFFFFIRTPFQ